MAAPNVLPVGLLYSPVVGTPVARRKEGQDVASTPPRHHSALMVALAVIAIVAAILIWNADRPAATGSLYLVPPALALVFGLPLAVWLHHLRRRWLAAILAIVTGVPAGLLAGIIAWAAVSAVVGPSALQGNDAFAGNEVALAFVVAPLECALVALIGALRSRAERPLERTPPVRVGRPGHPLAADPVSALMPHAAAPRHRHYRVTLIVGLLIFAALTFATAQSGSDIAVVAVLVIGSFLVPVVYVQYLDEIDAFGGVPFGMLLRVGILTALFGIPSAGFLEAFEGAGAGGLLPSILTGLTEEGVKILLVYLLVRQTRYRFELDGVIIGAAAGMGFAAFEDAGYALASLSQHGVPAFLGTLWLRQALGPFGHGTWTASIAAVIWRTRYGGVGRYRAGVFSAYLVSSGLHAAWDWDPLPGIGSFVWLLTVGALSIIRLRALVRQSIAQEARLLGSPGT